MPLAEADSLLAGTDPLIVPLDVEADLAELRRLAIVCGRFGPVAGLEEAERPESLLVDVTGCGPFFGNETGLARDAVMFLSGQGYAARAGLADTPGLAWAASRKVGRRTTLVVPGGGEAWLARRPVDALRLDMKTLGLLETLGLWSVGDVLRLPRAELPSRFGPLLTRRLDQALGLVPEPIEPVRPPVPVAIRWSSDTPLTDRIAVSAVLSRLIGRLVGRLPVWEGVTSLSCRFDDRSPLVVGAASPARSADRLVSLVALALDREPPPAEVSRLVVSAETVRLPPPDRTSLFDDRTDAENDRLFSRLIERLAGRLGAEAVVRRVRTGDPVPERSARSLPATGAVPRALKPPHGSAVASVPLVLLSRPEPIKVLSVYPDGPPRRLTLRGQSRELVLALGPERYETGWATTAEVQRDYWRIETDDGERLWVYRCRRHSGWFLHGLFG